MAKRIQYCAALLILILTIIWVVVLTTALWASFEEEDDENIISKSNEEWTVVEVHERVEVVAEDNSLTKYVIINNHGQLDFSRVYISDTDLYEDLEVGDLLKLKVEDDRISEVKKYN